MLFWPMRRLASLLTASRHSPPEAIRPPAQARLQRVGVAQVRRERVGEQVAARRAAAVRCRQAREQLQQQHADRVHVGRLAQLACAHKPTLTHVPYPTPTHMKQ